MGKCPYCGDSGFIGTGYIEKNIGGHKSMYPHTEPCYCRVNISIGKKFGILSPVSSANPKDSEIVHKLYGGKDLLFYGSEDIFLYIVKSFFLNGFMYKNYMILEGGTIVERYNVPKDTTGDWLTTSHLNQYDLLVIMFTTSARYASIKDCVTEVIKNRGRLAKPTWVYTTTLDHLKDAREYSPELEPYLEPYKKVNLDSPPEMKGYVPRSSALRATEKDVNNSLGNM